MQQPIGQLYYALANDTAQDIADGTLTEAVRFAPGAFRQDISRRLEPGAGRVYTLNLAAGQLLRLNLDAPQDSTLLSLYLPDDSADSPAVFADSEQTTWSGGINSSGDYELVVVNRADQPVNAQLTVSVDNVTSAPPVAPEEEVLPPISEEDEATDEPSAEDGEASDLSADDTGDAADAETTNGNETPETDEEAAGER